MKRRLLPLLVLSLGCPEDPPPPPVAVVQLCDFPDEGGPAPLLDIPFPSDLYREPDGTLAELPGVNRFSGGSVNVQSLAKTYGDMNGFGVSTGAFFAFSGPLDAATLPQAAFLVDIDPASSAQGELVPVELFFNPETLFLSVIPARGVVLREGTTYAAFVTNALRAEDGAEVLADDDFLLALSDPPAKDPGVEEASALLGPAADALVDLGLISAREELIGLTVYTTQSVTKDFVAIREMLDDPAQIPAPAISFPEAELIFDTKPLLDALLGDARDASGEEILGLDQPGGIAHEHIGVVASGFYPSPQFQPDDAGEEDDERFQYDENGLPVLVNGARLLPIYVVLPDPALVPMPQEGYPVVIVQHGLGGNRTAVWNFGDALAREGFALVAIDAVNHGSRLPGAQDLENNIGQGAGFLGDPGLRDGIAEADGGAALLAFFENLLNLGAVRDNFRQSIVDLMAVARLLREPTLDLSLLSAPFGEAPRLDPARVFYFGGSFGGILGGSFLGVEPGVGGGVLNVPGGALLLDLFPNSPAIGGSLLPNLVFLWALPDTFRFTRDDPFLHLAQAAIEAGDPILYARHVIKEPLTVGGQASSPKGMLLVEATGDEVVPNQGTSALALAMGVELAIPFYPGGPLYPPGDSDGLPTCDSTVGECDGNMGGGVTGVLVQYSPASHGSNLSRFFGGRSFTPGFPFSEEEDPFPLLPQSILVPNSFLEGVDAVLAFLGDLRDGLPPRVIHLAPPVADFDGDGVLDELDSTPLGAGNGG